MTAGRAGGGSRRDAGSAPLIRTGPLCRWVAYQEAGFSGEQYVLEKGVYRNCDDWGAGNSALASLQPVLQVRSGRGQRGLWRVGLGGWEAGSWARGGASGKGRS